MPRSVTPRTWSMTPKICVAILSSVARSRPMILTELAPLTPDSPSSILSWMYCEKLNVTPVNSPENSFCNSAISPSFVMPGVHCSIGFSGAKNSALLKPAASLPSSGRPCWETTVTTSGRLRRISRMRSTTGMPASSEIVGGIVARIHRLPSSRVGRNSPPSRGASTPATARNATPIATTIARCDNAQCRTGW